MLDGRIGGEKCRLAQDDQKKGPTVGKAWPELDPTGLFREGGGGGEGTGKHLADRCVAWNACDGADWTEVRMEHLARFGCVVG